MTIFEDIQQAKSALKIIESTATLLQTYTSDKALEIAKYLRVGKSGIELDPKAIEATLIRPYTLIPINPHEAWMISWGGIKMPIFGYVVAKDGPFIKSRVSRSMDLITPFPTWLKQEMDWKDPEHKVVIDSSYTGVHVLEGDEDSFKKRYGQFLGGKIPGKSAGAASEYKIRGGDAWIKLVSALIRDGILPYAPKPVDKAHWNPKAKLDVKLVEILEKLNYEDDRPYIERAVNEWRESGAMLFNIPPGGGKSLIFYIILTYFVGKVLLFADTTPLVEKWEKALKELCPNADVTVSTYAGAQKYKDMQWDLILFDEAQRLPANSFSKLAFFKTHYRAGATGTAWREDERQHLIVALCGKPFYIPWEELIATGILKKPRITVSIVKNESAKISYVKNLVSKRKGKALIYCDWIERGNEFANALNAPFINGQTKGNKLQQIEDVDVAVVSKIADRGLSFQDIRLVIEVAFMGKSREQFGQRVGRLLHGDFEGHFHTVFTPDEYEAYKPRILGVELELAGEVDIEYLFIGDVKEPSHSRPAKSVVHVSKPKVKKAAPEKVLDDVDKVLNIHAIAVKIDQANKNSIKNAVRYTRRVMRYCWKESLSPQEIADGIAATGKNAIAEIKAACMALTDLNLMISHGDGKFIVNQKYLKRLEDLSQRR